MRQKPYVTQSFAPEGETFYEILRRFFAALFSGGTL